VVVVNRSNISREYISTLSKEVVKSKVEKYGRSFDNITEEDLVHWNC
jgi:hypothetical protein